MIFVVALEVYSYLPAKSISLQVLRFVDMGLSRFHSTVFSKNLLVFLDHSVDEMFKTAIDLISLIFNQRFYRTLFEQLNYERTGLEFG